MGLQRVNRFLEIMMTSNNLLEFQEEVSLGSDEKWVEDMSLEHTYKLNSMYHSILETIYWLKHL